MGPTSHCVRHIMNKKESKKSPCQKPPEKNHLINVESQKQILHMFVNDTSKAQRYTAIWTENVTFVKLFSANLVVGSYMPQKRTQTRPSFALHGVSCTPPLNPGYWRLLIQFIAPRRRTSTFIPSTANGRKKNCG